MRFEVTTLYTPSDMRAILALQRRLTVRPRRGVMQAPWLYAFFGAILVLTAGRDDLHHPLPWVLAGLFVLVGCYTTPVAQGLRLHLAGWVLWRGYRSKGQTLRFAFRQERYEVEDGSRTHTFSYGDLEILGEDAHRFYLIPKAGGCQVLKKSDFTVGDPTPFPAFLRDRNPKLELLPLEGAAAISSQQ